VSGVSKLRCKILKPRMKLVPFREIDVGQASEPEGCLNRARRRTRARPRNRNRFKSIEDEDEPNVGLYQHPLTLIGDYAKSAQFLFRFDWTLAASGAASMKLQ